RTLITRPRFRRGPPFLPIDDGISGIKSSDGKRLDLFPAARLALASLAAAGTPAAIVSSTHREAWVREWLMLLRVDSTRHVCDVVPPPLIIIRDGSKR
ncbi:MAG: hypothetical protein SGPRY_003067, partial [Prymnesium sp.]